MDKKLFEINKKSIIELMSWLLGGFLLLFITEYLQRGSISEIITFAKDRTNAFVINYMMLLIITSVIFILKRKKTTYFIISLISILLSIINKVILEVRGMPITYSDIFSIKDGMSIANKYISIQMVIGLLAFITISIAIIVWLFNKEKKGKRITSYTNIIITIIMITVFSISLKSLTERKIIDVLRWDLTASYEYNGFSYSLLNSYFGYHRKKPEEYNKVNIENIKNETNAVPAISINDNNKKNKPNIIFVQLESFMDPTRIKEAKFSQDPVPNFRKLQKENLSGYLNVPVTGGGTARTEFEVLTGNNFDYLIPGEIPYDSFAKQKNINSVATTLKEQGYETTIMHNFEGNFYNRNEAFENLGFDRFISMEYMQNIQKTPFGWTKDMVLADYIQKSLDQNEKPDLISAISVEGHGKYSNYDKGLDLPIKVQTTLSEQDKYELYHYANQIKGTDDFIGALMNIVDNRKEDTIVVFYGDHTPALSVFSKDDFYLDKYEAPYAVYSNFNIPKEKQNLEAYQLSTLMMKQSGVDYGPIEKIHADRDNEKDYQKKLELVQYDMLFGKQYYLSDKEKAKENKMKMGLEDITIESITKENKVTTIKGKNFTNNSHIYIDGKKVETRFINQNTLEADNIKNMKKIVVKQLGKYDGELSSTNELTIK